MVIKKKRRKNILTKAEKRTNLLDDILHHEENRYGESLCIVKEKIILIKGLKLLKNPDDSKKTLPNVVMKDVYFKL